MDIGAQTVEKKYIIGGRMKEKNYCDKCKRTTWHNYEQTEKDKDGYTECLVCKHKRYFDNLKYTGKEGPSSLSNKWR